MKKSQTIAIALLAAVLGRGRHLSALTAAALAGCLLALLLARIFQ